MDLEAACRRLRARGAEMERLLGELVAINSHTANAPGCDAVADRLDAALARPALELSRHPAPGGRFGAHLSAETTAARRPDARPVLLVGHHDTVFPPGTFEGFSTAGDRAFGPGVLDMKGGLVAIVEALGALDAAGRLAATPLRLVVVSDEEVGSPSSGPLLARLAAAARGALVFESGRAGDRIVTRRKGTGALVATFHGRAAHAGNAHADGANAIWALARFVDEAQRLTDYAAGITVNVGRIEGGQGKNTVPERATAEVDLRFVTAETGEALVRALREAADLAAATVAGTRAELVGGISRPPLERTEASAALAARYGACQRAAGLGDGEAALQGGGSDANSAAALGVPAICGLGPRGTGYHTRDEQIERATLPAKAEALLRFLWPLAD